MESSNEISHFEKCLNNLLIRKVILECLSLRDKVNLSMANKRIRQQILRLIHYEGKLMIVSSREEPYVNTININRNWLYTLPIAHSSEIEKRIHGAARLFVDENFESHLRSLTLIDGDLMRPLQKVTQRNLNLFEHVKHLKIIGGFVHRYHPLSLPLCSQVTHLFFEMSVL